MIEQPTLHARSLPCRFCLVKMLGFREWAARPRTEVIAAMRPNIHPAYQAVTVTCSCGNRFETRSTLGRELQVEVCSNCHPFYTGKQKMVDTGGRVDKFRRRYGAKDAAATP